jgi:hypothetical protein
MNTRQKFGASTVRRAVTWMATLTLLAACSVGGGQSQGDTAGPPDPPPTGSCDATGAIEGGGRNKLAGVVSEIGSDGRVSVSDVSFAASAARIFVDGASATVAKLRVGDVVSVTGSLDLDTQTGCASAIFADADVTAVIDSVDAGHQTLTLLGQQVRVDADTVFGDDVQPAQLSSLQPGDRVRVTGLYVQGGAIAARRIDRAAGEEGYFVAGAVSSLDSQGKTFRINEMVVQYDGAALDGFAAAAPREGDNVRVTGAAFAGGSVTSLQPARVEYIDYGTPLSIEPSRISISDGRTIYFTVSSGPGTVTWTVSKSGGGACGAQDCGVIDANGRYTAPTGLEQRLVLVTATLISDPKVSATGLVQIDPIPFPHSGPYTVAGDVFSATAGMIADAPVDIWVDLGNRGYSYWWANGQVTTDSAGHFEAPNLPDSQVQVFVVAGGYVQPCAVNVAVKGDVSVQVEMVANATLDAFDPPRPQSSGAPALTGQVYEVTTSGRQAVAGAAFWVETALERPIATTMSDRGGGYFLCNLGKDIFIYVSKDGFVTRYLGPIDASQSGVLDIQLERSPAGP